MDNYEQKYKNALSWMQSLYKGLHGKTKEEAETYFPELTESEDERIRKEIIYHIQNCDDTIDEETGKRMLDWLEKVGNIIKEWGDLKVRYIQDDLQDMVDLKQKIEQGEQNPAWSEEDDKMLQNILECLRHGWKKLPTDILKYESWLKSLKGRVQPKPKQEWSEEDRETIDYLIDYLENELDSSYTKEDKEEFTKEIELLKSLRTQNTWKPNERQIYLLNWVANILLKDDGIVEKETAKELQQLLEQLKKLKK